MVAAPFESCARRSSCARLELAAAVLRLRLGDDHLAALRLPLGERALARGARRSPAPARTRASARASVAAGGPAPPPRPSAPRPSATLPRAPRTRTRPRRPACPSALGRRRGRPSRHRLRRTTCCGGALRPRERGREGVLPWGSPHQPQNPIGYGPRCVPRWRRALACARPSPGRGGGGGRGRGPQGGGKGGAPPAPLAGPQRATGGRPCSL